MPDSPFRPLTNEKEWKEALSHSTDQPVLLFKHSNACPVSGQAHQEMLDLAESENVPTYKLVVQESRSVSDEIADALGIRHETPQAIILKDREPTFDTSHFDVTAETLREAIDGTAQSR